MISRKEFLKQSAAWGAAAVAGLSGGLPGKLASAFAATGKSRVVIIRNPAVVKDGQVNQAVVSQMLRQAMLRLTGAKIEAEAWRKFIKPTDVVGIKVNCLFGTNCSTRPEVTNAIVAGLGTAGVPERNVIIWDRSTRDLIKSGFTPNADGPGVKVLADDDDWEAQPTKLASFNGRLSKILTQKITALINAPILKDHSGAGLTCAMKNHYGSFNNPGEHHGNHCDPYIADLNSLPAIKNKTRLIVCDAIMPIPQGGPGGGGRTRWPYGGLLVSTDPVALDTQGLMILNARRQEIGTPILTAEQVPQLASAAARGLGTNDPAKMEVIEIA